MSEDKTHVYDEMAWTHVVEQALTATCQASPRFGEIHLIKRLCQALHAESHSVQMVALCYTAMRNLEEGAMASHAFCHRHVLNGLFEG